MNWLAYYVCLANGHAPVRHGASAHANEASTVWAPIHCGCGIYLNADEQAQRQGILSPELGTAPDA